MVLGVRAGELEDAFVEATQDERAEVNGIDAIGDILQGHVFAREDVGDVEEPVVPADRAISADPTQFEVGRVVELGQALREGLGGSAIVVSRDIHAQRLVRALGVIDEAEAVEDALLSTERAGGRASGLGFEGAMETFMAAVLLRASGLDEFGADAQMEPPDLEFGEAENGLGGKGDAIIRANQGGQAEFGEESSEDGLDERKRDGWERLATEEVAAEGVDYGEGIAIDAIGGEKLTLEVHGPDVVGLLGHGEGLPRMTGWGASAPRTNEMSALEEIADGAGGGPGGA